MIFPSGRRATFAAALISLTTCAHTETSQEDPRLAAAERARSSEVRTSATPDGEPIGLSTSSDSHRVHAERVRTLTCDEGGGPRSKSFPDLVICGDALLDLGDAASAAGKWRAAFELATSPGEQCEVVNRLRRGLHPEADLRGIADEIVEQCQERAQAERLRASSQTACMRDCQNALALCRQQTTGGTVIGVGSPAADLTATAVSLALAFRSKNCDERNDLCVVECGRPVSPR